MVALALAFSISALVLAILARHPGIAPHDLANERSLHEGVVPRAGGWAVLGGWAVAACVAGPLPGMSDSSFGVVLVAIAGLFAISLVDDYRGVGAAWRFAVHVACAILVATILSRDGGGGLAWVAATSFVLVAATNCYNFMDGSDGLAGAMAVSGFASLAAGAALAGAPHATLLALALAALPFLARNFPPARIFLGDAGSAPLGFLAGVAGVAGAAAGTWPAWFPVLVFLPFLADASVTLAKRALAGERVWEAHRNHYYQRLVRAGFGHRGTLAVYGALMVGCGATAVACAAWRPGAGPLALAAWVAIVALVFGGIDYHWRQRG
jgi:UDP-N-acetylmuramyl pentapeptide phosphotransferase/UDP-N-acetylglucosamine-1-phosphate transferase